MEDALKRLEGDIATARRGREAERLVVLTVLLSRVQRIAKDDRKSPNRSIRDDDVSVAANDYVKETNETRSMYAERGRDHAKEDREIAIVSAYLPARLSRDELIAIIDAQIEGEVKSPKLIGKVIAHLKANHAAAYDSDEALSLVRARIA